MTSTQSPFLKSPDLSVPYAGYLYSYPHKTAYKKFDRPLDLAKLWRKEDRSSLFFYAHIPFCKSKCGFCNLFSLASPSENLMEQYVTTLEKQANAVKNVLGQFSGARYALGGGTPSDLSVPQLHRVMRIFFNTLGISQDRSGAVEISPATISEKKLSLFREYKVSRISVGVQSFVQTELRTIARGTRIHQITACLDMVKQLNFPVTNVDLIYGIPGQTPDTLAKSLKTALSFNLEQIFLYPLYTRDLTPLKDKSISENALILYQTGRDILLENGYVQDSMRMFRKPHPHELNNSDEYCCQEDGMIGLGTGARSYTRSVHYATPYAVGQPQIKHLIESYIKLDENDFNVAENGIVLSRAERRRRYLIKSILKCQGMKKQDYLNYFGSDCESDFVQIRRLKQKGLLVDSGTHIKLTEKGIMYSDAIGPFFISQTIRRRMAAHPAV